MGAASEAIGDLTKIIITNIKYIIARRASGDAVMGPSLLPNFRYPPQTPPVEGVPYRVGYLAELPFELILFT